MLEDKIRALRARKDILLMPHIVLGYPSFEANRESVRAMVAAGAEIVEMQIPFSDPMADGPVILAANAGALKNGTTTESCFVFAQEMKAAYPQTIFIFMTYCNILFAHGIERFVTRAASLGIEGVIVPDLPPEEGSVYIAQCQKTGLSPIFIFTPTSSTERLQTLATVCAGMAYCVVRRGVTGVKTTFDSTLDTHLARYRKATTLPLALGFGIQNAQDVALLKGRVDIAVLGTKLLSLQAEGGAEAVGQFLASFPRGA